MFLELWIGYGTLFFLHQDKIAVKDQEFTVKKKFTQKLYKDSKN